jgi:hypothetical protein
MITPSYGLTATERVLPRLALDWTTGLSQPGVDVTRAGVATFVGVNNFIQSATADTQRVDWSTGTAGLLVEETRVNRFLYSNDFSTTWSLTGVTIDASVIITPSGELNAQKLAETTAFDVHTIHQDVSVTSGTPFTYSRYFKAAERDSVTFNLSTLTVTVISGSGVTHSIKGVGNGWYRCSITATPVANGTSQVRLYLKEYGAYAGTIGFGLYIYGAQLEAGAFPTSYIPTEATAVTRNADVATMTGTNFSDWFNATEGTIVASYDSFGISASTNPSVLAISNNTTSNQIRFSHLGTAANFAVIPSAGDFASISVGGAVNNTVYTNAGGYKVDNASFYRGAALAGNDTSVDIPTVNRMNIGMAALAGFNYLNGHIQYIRYYPQRLTNAELQAFSK